MQKIICTSDQEFKSASLNSPIVHNIYSLLIRNEISWEEAFATVSVMLAKENDYMMSKLIEAMSKQQT